MKEQNGWRIITDSSIIIDLSTCKYPRDIHFKLQEAFGFPENYGANWSAFWDYLDDFCGDIESLTTVSVIGLDKLGQDLQHYAKKCLKSCAARKVIIQKSAFCLNPHAARAAPR